MKLYKFVLKQINDLKHKGISEFFNKIKAFIKFVFNTIIFLLFLPVALFIIIIRPFILFRFVEFPSDRIGGWIIEVTLYLSLKEIEKKTNTTFDFLMIDDGKYDLSDASRKWYSKLNGSKTTVDVLYHHHKICNNYLKNLFLKKLKIRKGYFIWHNLSKVTNLILNKLKKKNKDTKYIHF